jgi:hypothetical protein
MYGGGIAVYESWGNFFQTFLSIFTVSQIVTPSQPNDKMTFEALSFSVTDTFDTATTQSARTDLSYFLLHHNKKKEAEICFIVCIFVPLQSIICLA